MKRRRSLVLPTPPTPSVPYGICQCAAQCGQKTKIATKTSTADGVRKGEPNRFIRGHNTAMSLEEQIKRFWERVKIGKPEECWPWTGGKSNGYGILQFDGEVRYAHTVAWQLTHGAVPPPPLCVLHHCDNPPCCNPNDLFQGTKGDNMRDMAQKGRSGGRPNARLTPKEARQAVELVASGTAQQDVAKRLGVTRQNISNVIGGRQYSRFTGIQVRPRPTWKDKVGPEDIQKIKLLHKSGVSYRLIAKQFEVATMAIFRIVNG